MCCTNREKGKWIFEGADFCAVVRDNPVVGVLNETSDYTEEWSVEDL